MNVKPVSVSVFSNGIRPTYSLVRLQDLQEGGSAQVGQEERDVCGRQERRRQESRSSARGQRSLPGGGPANEEGQQDEEDGVENVDEEPETTLGETGPMMCLTLKADFVVTRYFGN